MKVISGGGGGCIGEDVDVKGGKGKWKRPPLYMPSN